MICLSKTLYQEILSHLTGELTNEGCGLLAGSNDEIKRVIPMKNREPSPLVYEMDPQEQLKVFRSIREEGLELLGIYHSHPHSPAYPSEKDKALAFYPECFYLIFSFLDEEMPIARAFWIREGVVQEETVLIG